MLHHHYSRRFLPDDCIIVLLFLSIAGINNFFHPYWKKGSDFIHFSRTEHYDHLNEYIRFTDQQAEIAAKNYINIDKLGIMYEYDEEGLEDALDSDYWRPTVVKSRQTGQRDTQDTQQHHRRQSESEGAYLTYDGGDSSSETTKMKAKSIDLLSRKQKRKNTKKERKAQRAARRRRTRQRRQDEL